MVQILELVLVCIARERRLGSDRPVMDIPVQNKQKDKDRKNKNFQITEVDQIWAYAVCT